MRRVLVLIILFIAGTVGLLAARGALPFTAVLEPGMEPALRPGYLLGVKPITDIRDIKVGDIIIYNIPDSAEGSADYPASVAHRVTAISNQPTVTLLTAGDNTGADPYQIRPQDLRGTVGFNIPYLGMPLLLFRSQHSPAAFFAILALITVVLFIGRIKYVRKKLHRVLFAPVIDEERRTSWLLTRKIAATEKKMDATEDALQKFSAAIAEYAQHLSSHTSAIQGLSEASQELKTGAAEQNRVLSLLMGTVAQPKLNIEELTSRAEEASSQIEALTSRVLEKSEDITRARRQLEAENFPPGCARVKRPRNEDDTPTQ